MIQKIKTILWFVKNPQYLSQIYQILKRNKNKEMELTAQESLEWCKLNSISQKNALQLFNIDHHEELMTLFPKEISDAHGIEQKCPVKMGGEGAISILYHIVKSTQSKNIVETGVAYGWSSLSILLAINDIDDARLISNDMPYIKMNNDDFVGCIIPKHLHNKWELQRMPDVKGIPLALKKFKNKIDLCHYDSDKSYTGRMWSAPLLWDALKLGGVFISDDINDNLAFKHFCEKVNRSPIIIEHLGKYVGILVK